MRKLSHISFPAALVFIVTFWLVGSRAAVQITVLLLPADMTRLLADSSRYTLPLYLIRNSGFVFLLVGTVLAVRYVLRMSVINFITDAPAFRYRRSFAAAGIWLTATALLTAGEGLLMPENYLFEPDYRAFFLFLFPAAVTVVIQASSEELLFRTLLGRWVETYTGRLLPPVILSGMLFLFAHLMNPEIQRFGASAAIYLYYFLFGAMLMLFSKLDGGYELAIGIHIGNNLFSSLLVNYDGSVMPTPSLFTAQSITPTGALIVLGVSAGISSMVFIRKQSGIR
jgi:uncharacterized protein